MFRAVMHRRREALQWFCLRLMVCILLLALPAMAQDAGSPPKPTATQTGEGEGLLSLDFSSKKTVIESNKMLLFAKTRTFTYLGGVQVEHGDMTLTCEKLDGSYNEANEIETLIARENVYIEKGENIKASGNKAVFKADSQTLRLTENPQLEQEGSLLSADEVLIYLQEDRSEAIGNVRVTVLEDAADPNEAANGNKQSSPTLLQ